MPSKPKTLHEILYDHTVRRFGPGSVNFLRLYIEALDEQELEDLLSDVLFFVAEVLDERDTVVDAIGPPV